ncbi:hypothetical protein GGX14DRAFT_30406 [Mycena pura]|uniref:C2H2-type domain-containing protein n=1 Tax=Mycena pura TaxID=153505 RepID=A0AAD6UX13_9AGAR|nr:hypothetical protein GGX14DRAFT_30406 [Mycena pura]
MLTFPVEELSRLQLSFKVGVPHGSFSFDVSPTSTADGLCPKGKSGAKVHFDTVSDATGVVLKVWTSDVNCNDPSQIQSFSDVSGPIASGSMSLPATSSSFDPNPDILGLSESGIPWELYSLDAGPLSQTPPNVLSDSDGLDFGNDWSIFGFITQAAQDFENDVVDSTSTDTCLSEHVYPTILTDQVVQSPPSTDQSPPSFTSEACTPYPTSDSSSSPPPSSPSTRPKLKCTEPACSRRFKSRYTLKAHLETHKSKTERVFPCTMGCAAFFSRQHDRLRHEVTQHGRVCEWVCKTCSGFFSSSRTLDNHKCRGATGGTRWIKPVN